MKTFRDLEFKTRTDGASQALLELKEGVYISVVAGEYAYSTPRKSGLDISDYDEFEVALMRKDIVGYPDFVTKDYLPNEIDDVLPFQDRAHINTVMLIAQSK